MTKCSPSVMTAQMEYSGEIPAKNGPGKCLSGWKNRFWITVYPKYSTGATRTKAANAWNRSLRDSALVKSGIMRIFSGTGYD